MLRAGFNGSKGQFIFVHLFIHSLDPFMISRDALGRLWLKCVLPNFRGSITRCSLRGPDTDLPTLIKNEPSWTTILKDSVIIFILNFKK